MASVLSDAGKAELRKQIDTALQVHYGWIGRLSAAISSGMPRDDLDEARRPDICPLGVWLTRDISPALRTMDLYEQTCALHADFHVAVADVLALVVRGDRPEAEHSFKSGMFADVALRLRAKLNEWRAHAE